MLSIQERYINDSSAFYVRSQITMKIVYRYHVRGVKDMLCTSVSEVSAPNIYLLAAAVHMWMACIVKTTYVRRRIKLTRLSV